MKYLIDESRFVGLTDDALISEVAVKLGLAIGTYFGNKKIIATARDYRSDSHMIKRAISSGLMATGIEILDLHAASTSTLQFVVRRFGCDAGISFTGAHYLDGEISIRIHDSTGNELEKEELEKIADFADEESFKRVKKDQIGSIESIANGMLVYKNALISFIDKKPIIEANFRIVLDLSLGPLGSIVPSILTDLNIDLTTMNAHRTSAINKEGALYPDPESIRRVSKTVIAVNADLGIIIDVEGTKVIFVDDKGNLLSAEDTSSFLIYRNLKERSGTIILSNLYTKKFDDKGFLSFKGTKIIRTADSPGNIARQIDSERAIIGSSDNGKMYNPIWGAEADGILTALSMLIILANSKMKMSELIIDFKNLLGNSENVPNKESIFKLPENFSQLQFFRNLRHIQDYKVRDTLIGIKIKLDNGIVHYMTTMNELEIKLLLEAENSELLANLMVESIELATKAISTNN